MLEKIRDFSHPVITYKRGKHKKNSRQIIFLQGSSPNSFRYRHEFKKHFIFNSF